MITEEDCSHIEEVVYRVFEEELAVPRARIKKSAHLVRDLRIDTDDLTFLYIPALQSRLGLQIPVAEWGNVSTVQDTIELLIRHSKLKKSKKGSDHMGD